MKNCLYEILTALCHCFILFYFLHVSLYLSLTLIFSQLCLDQWHIFHISWRQQAETDRETIQQGLGKPLTDSVSTFSLFKDPAASEDLNVVITHQWSQKPLRHAYETEYSISSRFALTFSIHSIVAFLVRVNVLAVVVSSNYNFVEVDLLHSLVAVTYLVDHL